MTALLDRIYLLQCVLTAQQLTISQTQVGQFYHTYCIILINVSAVKSSCSQYLTERDCQHHQHVESNVCQRVLINKRLCLRDKPSKCNRCHVTLLSSERSQRDTQRDTQGKPHMLMMIISQIYKAQNQKLLVTAMLITKKLLLWGNRLAVQLRGEGEKRDHDSSIE